MDKKLQNIDLKIDQLIPSVDSNIGNESSIDFDGNVMIMSYGDSLNKLFESKYKKF